MGNSPPAGSSQPDPIRSREEFLARLDAVLARPSSSEEVQRRMGRVAATSWDARLEEVLEVVNQKLAAAEPVVALSK